MTQDSFSEFQIETFELALPQCRDLSYMVIGLVNEAGELAGKLKKVLRGDSPLSDARAGMLAELGDVLWYAAGIASVLNGNLGEVAQGNLDKLKSRLNRGKLQGDGDLR